jgi:hypothetical protein
MTDADAPEDPHPTADADAIRDGVYRALRDLLLRVALVAALVAALLLGLELAVLGTGIGRPVPPVLGILTGLPLAALATAGLLWLWGVDLASVGPE